MWPVFAVPRATTAGTASSASIEYVRCVVPCGATEQSERLIGGQTVARAPGRPCLLEVRVNEIRTSRTRRFDQQQTRSAEFAGYPRGDTVARHVPAVWKRVGRLEPRRWSEHRGLSAAVRVLDLFASGDHGS